MQNSDAADQRPTSSSALPASTAAPSLHVQAFVRARSAEHRDILGQRLVALRQLAGDTAAANASVSDLAAMEQKVALLCNDLRDCLSREESMVFPALVRLITQSNVSKCQAGMVRARLRFMVAEQDALLSTLAEISDIARQYLSPDGPCEFCHELLTTVELLAAEMNEHIRLEQEELFAWALAREDWLIRQIADDADERCL